MDKPGSVEELMDRIQKTWSTWQETLSLVDQDNFTGQGAAGEWSLKNIIAHITWFEKEMVGLIRAHALVGSVLWNLPTDERNAAIYEDIRHQPLEQVLEESEQVHQQLLEALPTLSDEDLTDPSGFPNMPQDWQPRMLIAQNTYEHYEDHIRDVKMWLEKRDSSPRSA